MLYMHDIDQPASSILSRTTGMINIMGRRGGNRCNTTTEMFIYILVKVTDIFKSRCEIIPQTLTWAYKYE